MKYVVKAAKQYRKDYKRLRKSGHNIEELEQVIHLLSTGTTLPEKYYDHALKGELNGRRECHIRPDWLLLYRKNDDQLVLLLLRTGTHRQVLGIE